MSELLTQSRLKEIFEYNKDTSEFIRKSNKYRVSVKGSIVGSFATLDEAKAAYLAAAKNIYGDFARGHD